MRKGKAKRAGEGEARAAEKQRDAGGMAGVWGGMLRRGWVAVAGIFLLAMAAHWPAYKAAYIWDDDEYLTRNEAVQKWGGFWELWVPGNTTLYVPLVTSSLWVEEKIWGLGEKGADGVEQGAGYYVDNMILHGISAVLVFLIVRRMGLPGGVGGAWVAGAIYAVHPVTVESVAWLAERKNVLCGVMFFASLYFCCKWWGIFDVESGHEEGRRDARTTRRDYWLALVFFVLAMLSKVAACFLPVAVLGLVWWRRGKVTRREVLGVLPMVAVVVGLGSFVAAREHMQGGTEGADFAFTVIQRVAIAGNAFWFELGKLFWPTPLVVVYPRFPIEAGKAMAGWLYIGPAAWVGLVAGCFALRKRIGRGALAAVLIYTAGLFPTLGFVSFYTMIYTFVADHFQYLAMPVVIVYVVALAAWGWERVKVRMGEEAGRLLGMVRMGVVVGVLLPLGVLSVGASYTYQNPVTVWASALDVNPESWVVLENLAGAKLREVPLDFPTIYALTRQAIALRPNDWKEYAALSLMYRAVGDNERAAAALAEGETHMTPQDRARRNFYLRQNAEREAATRPVRADLARGMALEKGGKFAEAIGVYEGILQGNAGDGEARLALGRSYVEKGEAAKGIGIYRDVLGRDEKNADAWLLLAIALHGTGEEGEAAKAMDKARLLGGTDVLARHPEVLDKLW